MSKKTLSRAKLTKRLLDLEQSLAALTAMLCPRSGEPLMVSPDAWKAY